METILYVLLGAALAGGLIWARTRYLDFQAQVPADYADNGPQFDIRQQLNGPLDCEGVVFGPTGRVTSRFTANFDAKWEGNVGTMTEHFRYDTGTTMDRKWILTIGNDGKIKAEADDLVGAGLGKQQGAAVSLNYRIKLPPESGGHVLDATDWMYLVENGSIINRSQFRKYGIKVAELVATMRRKEAA